MPGSLSNQGRSHAGAIGPFEPLIDQLRVDGVRYFGAVPVEVEPLSFRYGRFSDLMRARVRLADRDEHVFIKLFKPQEGTDAELRKIRARILRDFEATRRVHEHFADRPNTRTVRPVASFPDSLAMVVGEVPGVTLQHWMTRHARWYPDLETQVTGVTALEHLGGWIRDFQKLGTTAQETVSVTSLREYLQSRLSQLCANDGLLTPALAGELLARFDRTAAAVDPVLLEAVPIHADLSPENVLVDNGVVTVLDFTMFKAGTRYHDVAHLYLQLERFLLKPWFREPVIRRLQAALLRGFEHGLTPQHPLFQLMVLQHLVCRALQPDFATPSVARRLVMRYVGWRHHHWLRALALARPDPAPAAQGVTEPSME